MNKKMRILSLLLTALMVTGLAFFDYAEPRVYFFIDYIAIMILFMMTGCLLMYVLNMISNKSP